MPMLTQNDFNERNSLVTSILNSNDINGVSYNTLLNNNLSSHLHFCGVIPEAITHDSTQEKIYSKYTDHVISCVFSELGYRSNVLQTRANSADVEVFANNYSFVADAKAFRLSRTAKNQKDFKIEAMSSWKGSHNYSVIVCPIFQLPVNTSQIYTQATTRNVLILSYSHLSLLLRLAYNNNQVVSQSILEGLFLALQAMNNSSSSINYWQTINGVIIGANNPIVTQYWNIEKQIVDDIINYCKQEGIQYYTGERIRINNMTQAEAIRELLLRSRLENNINAIQNCRNNNLLG